MKKAALAFLSSLAVITALFSGTQIHVSAETSSGGGQALVCIETAAGGNLLNGGSSDGYSWSPLMDVSGAESGNLLKAGTGSVHEIMLVE